MKIERSHNEILNYRVDGDIPPSTPAFAQQRNKLEPEVFEALFRETYELINNPITYESSCALSPNMFLRTAVLYLSMRKMFRINLQYLYMKID